MKTEKELQDLEAQAYDEYAKEQMYIDRWLAAPDKDQYDDWIDWADAHFNLRNQ